MFALLGCVRVVAVTAKQSTLQSPLQSHSSVLSAPPPTPSKPRVTILSLLSSSAWELPCLGKFLSIFPSPFPLMESRKTAAEFCHRNKVTRYPRISFAFYLVSEYPAPPAPPPPNTSPSFSRRKHGQQPQPPLDTGAGALTLLRLKASFSPCVKPLTNPSHARQRHQIQPLTNSS